MAARYSILNGRVENSALQIMLMMTTMLAPHDNHYDEDDNDDDDEKHTGGFLILFFTYMLYTHLNEFTRVEKISYVLIGRNSLSSNRYICNRQLSIHTF